MPRYKLTVEYDGGPFVGWQRQTNGRSVQQAIEEALNRLTGEAPTLRGAGRTDAGVHALGQVAHFDLEREWTGDKLRDGLNAHLRPEPVAILLAERGEASMRFAEELRRDPLLLVLLENGERGQRDGREGVAVALHEEPREGDVARDDASVLRHEREHEVAVAPEPVDEQRLAGPGKRRFEQVADLRLVTKLLAAQEDLAGRRLQLRLEEAFSGVLDPTQDAAPTSEW